MEASTWESFQATRSGNLNAFEMMFKNYYQPLYRAVHNASLNSIQHERVKQQYAHQRVTREKQPSGGANQLVVKYKPESTIHAAVVKLPEQCRLIFTMSRLEELKYQEIADQQVKTF